MEILEVALYFCTFFSFFFYEFLENCVCYKIFYIIFDNGNGLILEVASYSKCLYFFFVFVLNKKILKQWQATSDYRFAHDLCGEGLMPSFDWLVWSLLEPWRTLRIAHYWISHPVQLFFVSLKQKRKINFKHSVVVKKVHTFFEKHPANSKKGYYVMVHIFKVDCLPFCV